MRPRRVQKRRSRVATALVLLAVLVIMSAITAALFVPTSLEDFASTTAIVIVFEIAGFAITALWDRLTRKRRRDRLSG
jgi:peptidoglycan/LPS O-acetylase OafA/YrhL